MIFSIEHSHLFEDKGGYWPALATHPPLFDSHSPVSPPALSHDHQSSGSDLKDDAYQTPQGRGRRGTERKKREESSGNLGENRLGFFLPRLEKKSSLSMSFLLIAGHDDGGLNEGRKEKQCLTISLN